jgi:hypothetical protein
MTSLALATNGFVEGAITLAIIVLVGALWVAIRKASE